MIQVNDGNASTGSDKRKEKFTLLYDIFMENSHIRLEVMKHKPDLKNRSDLCEIQTKGSHSFTILQRIIWLFLFIVLVDFEWTLLSSVYG